MALVFPNICRYVIEQTFLGRPAINILDMDVQEHEISRAEAVFNVAGDIINNWDDHVMGALAEGVSFNAVSWVDLNTPDGPTGRRTSTSDTTLPKAGGASGNTSPASVAMLVSKQTVSARGQRQGRWFLPGVTEQWLNGNTIESSFIASVNTGLQSFLDGVSDEVPIEAVAKFPVVLHTTTKGVDGPIPPLAVGASRVLALTADSRVASQRRRNRP